jgi:hypothetical protein
VWEFLVHADDEEMIHTFVAQTNMSWMEFREQAYWRFSVRCEDVRLGYRISGEISRKMTALNCEAEWNSVLDRLLEKIAVVRTRTVFLELKNMVSDAFS